MDECKKYTKNKEILENILEYVKSSNTYKENMKDMPEFSS